MKLNHKLITSNSGFSCSACESSETLTLAYLEKWAAFKCCKCGLVQQHPMPTDRELIAYYQGFSFQPPKISEIEEQLAEIEASLKYFVGCPVSEDLADFLDYGGAAGIYCKAAERLGWKPTLFDYDEEMLDFARKNLGIDDSSSDLGDLESRRFDVIFSYHVIEHWNNIDQHFSRLLKILKPGGKLVVATPNAKSIEKLARPSHFNNYHNLWMSFGLSSEEATQLLTPVDSVLCFDPPRHLFAFTPDSLIAIGKRYGLEVEILTGYNTSRRYEPRQYVLGREFKAWKELVQFSSLRHPRLGMYRLRSNWKCLKSLLKLQYFSIRHPNLGEQLYARFTKPSE